MNNVNQENKRQHFKGFDIGIPAFLIKDSKSNQIKLKILYIFLSSVLWHVQFIKTLE